MGVFVGVGMMVGAVVAAAVAEGGESRVVLIMGCGAQALTANTVKAMIETRTCMVDPVRGESGGRIIPDEAR
jgi:TPP-dependent 2-oxoacid decarboxylase